MKKLKLLIVALITVLSLTWLLADHWSGRQLDDARKEWPFTGVALANVPQLFPRTSVNQSARALADLCRELGVNMVESSEKRAKRPSQEEQRAFKAIWFPLGEYLKQELERPTGFVEPPPSEIVTFLTKNEEMLVNISHLLVTNDLPEWTLDVEKGPLAPVPNLLGHLYLHHILIVQGLYLRANGNNAQAWSFLQASARLADSLFMRPDLISQLIAISEATEILVAMRKMNAPIPSWASSWPAHDLEQALMTVYTTHAWALLMISDKGLISTVTYEEREKVGTRIFSAISHPYIRISGAHMIFALKRMTRDRMREGLCTDRPSSLGTVEEQLPGWIVLPGRTIFANFWTYAVMSWESWHRLHHELMVHIEGTRSILAAKAVKAMSPTGHWPETLPEVASRCESFAWAYTVSPDGSITFQYTKPLQTVRPELWPLPAPANSLKYIDTK